jgi:membrane protein implicated in regulation of membrane protease activity
MSRHARRLEWGVADAPPTQHPYRDTLLVYGGLALVIVVLAWATGSPLGKSALIAAVFFAFASIWSVARWRSRLRRESAEARTRDL